LLIKKANVTIQKQKNHIFICIQVSNLLKENY
jgi:hypothetical protein